MRKTLIATVALIASAAALSAQTPLRRPEIRPFAGALIATGDQRDLFKNAAVFGVQGALEMNPNFHFVGTFGYSSLTSKYSVSDAAADAFTYDAGVEFDMVRPLTGNWQFKPFVGAGLGGRSYRFSTDALKDQSCFAGYGALGTEFQLSRVALRLEGRDNMFCYRSPIVGVDSKTRNDIVLAFGLAYHIR
jgi:hypothetical protein